MIIIKKSKLENITPKKLILLVNSLGKLNSTNKEILSKYPKIEREYLIYCNRNDFREDILKGKIQEFYNDSKALYLVYCQNNKLKIDYEILEKLLTKIIKSSINTEYEMLFKNGFEKEDGEWNFTLDTINKVFKDKRVILYDLEV